MDKIGAMIINFILGSVEPEGLETFMWRCWVKTVMSVRNENWFGDEIHNKHRGPWSMDKKWGQSYGEIARREERFWDLRREYCRTQQLRYACSPGGRSVPYAALCKNSLEVYGLKNKQTKTDREGEHPFSPSGLLLAYSETVSTKQKRSKLDRNVRLDSSAFDNIGF